MLQMGLLWYDDNQKKVLKDKINEAAERYAEKLGQKANVCYVHPTYTGLTHECIRVLFDPAVRPHHFFVGVEEVPQVAIPLAS